MESVGRNGGLTMYEDMPAGVSPGLASTIASERLLGECENQVDGRLRC
jgi:hypothetical protein